MTSELASEEGRRQEGGSQEDSAGPVICGPMGGAYIAIEGTEGSGKSTGAHIVRPHHPAELAAGFDSELAPLHEAAGARERETEAPGVQPQAAA